MHPIGTQQKTVEARLKARWELARFDPFRFLKGFVRTCDQHDTQHPIKPFPVDRPYIRPLIETWQDNPLLCIVKSRQMLQTWLWCAIALWDAMFHQGRLIMLQSKREEDAVGDAVSGDGLLGRIKFILNHIPGRQILVPQYRSVYNKLMFPDINSTLWAIPQGGDIVRQRTASGILSDEAAFQEEFSNAYVAAMPTIRSGGWFVALSSANPGFFQRLYEDRIDEHG